MAYLAMECASFETRHSGVSVGAVDEMNHFSSQVLPVGEAKHISNYSSVAVESADLIRVPAASGQIITFDCLQDCSTSSLAYLARDGCDWNVSGTMPGKFGLQTATASLTEHWLTGSYFSADLDCAPLTPGKHYNLCVDPDGDGVDFNFGDTGVRVFVQGAYTPPTVLYGSQSAWYFEADASHLAPGRRYKVCTDLDGRHGHLRPGDTGFEVFVSPLEDVERHSLLLSRGAALGLACAGCQASAGASGPSFDAAAAWPRHGASASLVTNVVLAFSEAVQLAPEGVFQLWDTTDATNPAFEVAAKEIYAANAAAGGSLLRENQVLITPATLCTVPASCDVFTSGRSYYVTASKGTVQDLSGTPMAALDTSSSWQFTAVATGSDTVAPEVATVSLVSVSSTLATGFIVFTEDVSLTGSADMDLSVCGNSGCSTITGGTKSATLTPLYVAGTTDLTASRAQKLEFGMLEFQYELPQERPQQYQIRIPAGYVTDTGGNTGPSSSLDIVFDVGMVEGQEVLPASAGSQLFLASHCNVTDTETYFWQHSPGVNSLPVMLSSSGSASYPLVVTFDTADLSAIHYEVCVDVDGPGPVHRPGPTGLQIFMSPVTAVTPGTVTQDKSRTVTVSCPTTCTAQTFMYLGIDCEELARPGTVPEQPPFRTASSPLRATGVAGDWFFSFDAANLTAGVYYRLCLDTDGTGTTRYYGDTRHTVYISPVAGLRSPVVASSAAAVVNVACFARPEADFGWWPENDTEDLLMQGVQNFSKNYVHQLHWCNELTSGHLATTCDSSVNDGWVSEIYAERTTPNTFTGTTHLVVWQDIALLDSFDNLTSQAGYRNDAACAHAALARGYAYWTRLAAENICWFLQANAVAYASQASGYSSGPVEGQLWLLRLDTRSLLQGQYYTLCIDLDGYHQTQYVADTLMTVFVSPVQAVATTTIWKAQDQNISLECQNCTSSSKFTLSVKCEDAMVVGELVGEQTLVVTLDAAGDGMWTATVDAKTLAEGRHYRVCLELEESSPLGDTGFRIYVSPVYYVTPSIGDSQFEQLELACPSALCSRATELRVVPAYQRCGDGDLDEVVTLWVQVEGQPTAKDLRPSRLRGGVDALQLSEGRGRGAYFFVLDARQVEAGQSYRVCIDIDGVSGSHYADGDAGYLVYKPDTTVYFDGVGNFTPDNFSAPTARRLEEEEAMEDPVDPDPPALRCDMCDTGAPTPSRVNELPMQAKRTGVAFPRFGVRPEEGPQRAPDLEEVADERVTESPADDQRTPVPGLKMGGTIPKTILKGTGSALKLAMGAAPCSQPGQLECSLENVDVKRCMAEIDPAVRKRPRNCTTFRLLMGPDNAVPKLSTEYHLLDATDALLERLQGSWYSAADGQHIADISGSFVMWDKRWIEVVDLVAAEETGDAASGHGWLLLEVSSRTLHGQVFLDAQPRIQWSNEASRSLVLHFERAIRSSRARGPEPGPMERAVGSYLLVEDPVPTAPRLRGIRRGSVYQTAVLEFDTDLRLGDGFFTLIKASTGRPHGAPVESAEVVVEARNKLLFQPETLPEPNEQYSIVVSNASTITSWAGVAMAHALDTGKAGHWLTVQDEARARAVWSTLDDYHCLPSNGILPSIDLLWTEELLEVGDMEIRLYRCGQQCGQLPPEPSLLSGHGHVDKGDVLEWKVAAGAQTLAQPLRLKAVAQGFRLSLDLGNLPSMLAGSAALPLQQSWYLLQLSGGWRSVSYLSSEAAALQFTVCSASGSGSSLRLGAAQGFRAARVVLPQGAVTTDGKPSPEISFWHGRPQQQAAESCWSVSAAVSLCREDASAAEPRYQIFFGPRGTRTARVSRRLAFVSPVLSVYPDFVALAPEIFAENMGTNASDWAASQELMPPLRRTNFTVGCEVGSCSIATQVRLALDCAAVSAVHHRSSGPGYSQAIGLAPVDAFPPSSAAGHDGEAFQANLDVSSLLPGFHYHLCVDTDGFYGTEAPGESGFTVYGTGVSAISPVTIGQNTTQRMILNCSATGGCSTDMRGYVALGTCADRGDGLQAAGLENSASAKVSAAMGGNSFELVLDTSFLAFGLHLRLCVDPDGAGPLLFGTAGVVYLSPASNATPAVQAGNTANQVALICEGCSTSSSLLLASDCGDRVDAVNLSWGTAATTLSLDSGLTWAEVDATGLAAGAHYRICTDLDGTDGSMLAGDTALEAYVTPVTECIKCAVRPLAAQLLVLSCPSCEGPSATIDGRNNSNYTINGTEELEEMMESNLLPSYDFKARLFLAATSCASRPKTRLAAARVKGCGTGGAGMEDICNSSAIAGTPMAGEVRVETDVNSYEASVTHLDTFYVAKVDATGLEPGKEYLLCLDLDGHEGPQRYGDTGLRVLLGIASPSGVFVTPVTSVHLTGSYPSHRAVPQSAFTFQASAPQVSSGLRRWQLPALRHSDRIGTEPAETAWLWLAESCGWRQGGNALQVSPTNQAKRVPFRRGATGERGAGATEFPGTSVPHAADIT
ncbi:unnamed protein product [Effrenium voratum]|nr:unnamed protein product [Effrenium voratum]